MFKNLLGKIAGVVVKNPLKRRILVEVAEDAIVKELDRKTGGLASKVDEVV